MNGSDVLTLQILATYLGKLTCDVVATQCGANKFVSYHDHAEPVGLTNVRFLAASQVYSKSTYSYQYENGSFMHQELMKLMVNYAKYYPIEANTLVVTEVLAFLAALGTSRDSKEISDFSPTTFMIILSIIVIIILVFFFILHIRKSKLHS